MAGLRHQADVRGFSETEMLQEKAFPCSDMFLPASSSQNETTLRLRHQPVAMDGEDPACSGARWGGMRPRRTGKQQDTLTSPEGLRLSPTAGAPHAVVELGGHVVGVFPKVCSLKH